jgi:hypothetical protein
VPAQPRFSPLGVACEITAEARPAADAQIAVALSAPCRPEAPVTFTHAGLRATERTDADGRLDLTLPALAVEAGVAFVFDDGARAEARSLIPGAVLRDRVALEWQGRTGLELHARENGAAHGAPGHVHAGAPEAGAGRFVRLGDADVPGAWLAEIYSHPRRDARASGAAEVTVEARIGVANCGRTVTGRLLVPRGAEPAAPVALRLPIPGCEAIGDYLLLKTLSAGPTLAADQGR